MSETDCFPVPEARVESTCWSNPDVSQYKCPCSAGQSGGGCGATMGQNCLGAVEIPMGVNQGCHNAPATPSEVAWDTRYHTAPATGGMPRKSDQYYYRKYKKMKARYKQLCSQ